MELEFLTIGEYQTKEMYLQHINRMINVELNKGDTYNNLFEKLKERFKDNPKELQAVDDWIRLNKENQEDQNVFNTVICENDKAFASFNIRNK